MLVTCNTDSVTRYSVADRFLCFCVYDNTVSSLAQVVNISFRKLNFPKLRTQFLRNLVFAVIEFVGSISVPALLLYRNLLNTRKFVVKAAHASLLLLSLVCASVGKHKPL